MTFGRGASSDARDAASNDAVYVRVSTYFSKVLRKYFRKYESK